MKRSAGVLAGLAVAITLGAAVPAAGATPEVLAAKQLAAAENAARTTFRAALAAALLEVSAGLANVERAVAGAASPLEAGNELFTALEAFQGAILVAANLATNAQAEAAKAALATLGAGLGGIYPDAFYPGLGTPRERFETALAKDVAKAYAKVGKRITKVVAAFAAEGFGLNLRLRPPAYTDSRTWSEAIVDFILTLPPTVDLVVAFSDLAVLGDGQLRAAGSGFQSTGGPVEMEPIALVAFAHPGGDVVIEKEVSPVAGRWSSDLDGDALLEGVYVFAASQALTPGNAFSIGVR